MGFPGISDGTRSACNAGDPGWMQRGKTFFSKASFVVAGPPCCVDRREWKDAEFGDRNHHHFSPAWTLLLCSLVAVLRFSPSVGREAGCLAVWTPGICLTVSAVHRWDSFLCRNFFPFASAWLVGRLGPSFWIDLHTSILPSSDNIWQCEILGFISLHSK